MAAPDQALFRSVMGHFPSGVTVLTTIVGEQLHGMTVSAFCSVSLEPLLVLATIEKTTRMHALLLESHLYGASILGTNDEATSRFFADDRRLAGVEFAPGSYRIGVTGCPILPQAIAFLEARVQAVYDGGDHSIFLGEVVNADVLRDDPPLIFYRGGYATLRR
ncbi:MAG: flavin reductase family protein [Chloroflexi bacterium]|nr:MAG: flavin reductase family protein [Chloroflexota bacterium]